MNFENEDPMPEDNMKKDSNNFPKDNPNYNFNNNFGGNEELFKNDQFISNDMNGELNRNHYQYPEGIKENLSPQESQILEEQQRINKQIFKGFIVKVYGILSLQLFITLFLILLFQKESIKTYYLDRPIQANFWNFVSLLGFILVLGFLSNKNELGKKYPYNYIFLLILTLFFSLTCAFAAINYSFSIVFAFVLLTIFSSIAITMYAYSTKEDFNYLTGLFSVLISQFLGFFFLILTMKTTMLEIICCFVGSLLFGVYLVYDTQEILKKYGEAYAIDDYIYASLHIYIDIINLFMTILSIIAQATKKQ